MSHSNQNAKLKDEIEKLKKERAEFKRIATSKTEELKNL
jgi:hypothetical protein